MAQVFFCVVVAVWVLWKVCWVAVIVENGVCLALKSCSTHYFTSHISDLPCPSTNTVLYHLYIITFMLILCQYSYQYISLPPIIVFRPFLQSHICDPDCFAAYFTILVN